MPGTKPIWLRHARYAKRLQLLEEIVRGKKLVPVLGNLDTPFTASVLQQVKAAAAITGQSLAIFEARTVDQVSPAIDGAIKSGAASMLVLEDPVLLGAKRETADLVAQARRQPSMGQGNTPRQAD